MDREDKNLEMAIDAMITRAHDLKASIGAFILKLENEYTVMNWPSTLDSFALLSGQISSILRILKSEKTPLLRNRVLLPLLLSPDKDEELMKLTENRVSVFSHEVVPDYLRTKPDPEVESRDQLILNKVSIVSSDAAQKQITSMNKIANNVIDIIKSNREEWESESGQRASAIQTSSLADTTTLISAISLGKGLKSSVGSPKGPGGSMPPQNNTPRPVFPVGPAPGKVPSAIKTNIKSGNAMHPYAR